MRSKSMPGMMLTEKVRQRLREALEEDLGRGDVTTRCTLEEDLRARAVITAKQHGVVCGVEVTHEVVLLAEPEAQVQTQRTDGDSVAPGDVISTWEGRAHGLLAAERLALNMLGRLSGVATLTRSYVEAANSAEVELRDTRKTTPLWRDLEKYAVRVGGGSNHRGGLFDMILIKDNHIDLGGGIDAVVSRAVRQKPPNIKIEVECRTLAEVEQALQYPVDYILLDNMDLETMRRAVEHCAGRARLEASGGVDLARVAAIAATGVTDISVGALTHSAPSIDFSVRMETL